jgi:AraC-like DNA-binding protein
MQLAQIRSRALTGYRALVHELGGSPEPLLKAHGLLGADESDGEQMIDLRQVMALYDATAAKLGCPDFALRVSAHHALERLGGPLALVTYNAPTVADSINLASLYMPYFSPNMQYMLAPDETRGRHRLIHELKLDHCPERRHQIEMSMRVASETLSLLAQSRSAVKYVTMQHAAKMPLALYKRHFAWPVRFEQKENAVVFDSRVLKKPVAGRNPEIQRLAESFLRTVIDDLPRNLAGRVEALINRQLTNPKCTINLIAGQLAMHPRTLQRRLQEDGIRFDTLLDNVRKARAEHYLSQRDMHLITVTQLLGYTRQTSLNQSCLRWFGCSPLQFRRQAIGDATRAA